mmetsp:Transcript_3961/g.6070  ORF Transcript_3961/g.6070 Transcript_3961/m.6070 type:complete len:83 (-) Transcript_3961:265-513(-)
MSTFPVASCLRLSISTPEGPNTKSFTQPLVAPTLTVLSLSQTPKKSHTNPLSLLPAPTNNPNSPDSTPEKITYKLTLSSPHL